MQALTPKQQQFVEEYVLDHNGAGAAVRAGYSPRSAKEIAAELLTKPHLRAAIRAQEALAAQELGATRQKVLDGLLEAVAEARRKCEPMAMITAWREIAKISGYYAPDRVQVAVSSGGADAVSGLETMSDAELTALLVNQAAVVGGG